MGPGRWNFLFTCLISYLCLFAVYINSATYVMFSQSLRHYAATDGKLCLHRSIEIKTSFELSSYPPTNSRLSFVQRICVATARLFVIPRLLITTNPHARMIQILELCIYISTYVLSFVALWNVHICLTSYQNYDIKAVLHYVISLYFCYDFRLAHVMLIIKLRLHCARFMCFVAHLRIWCCMFVELHAVP